MVIKYLDNLKAKIAKHKLTSVEERLLWERIQNQIYANEAKPAFKPNIKSPYSPKRIFALREYVITILIIAILASSGGIAAAAEDSLPTSALYAIKINVTEPARSALLLTPQAKATWAIQKTERRLDEARQLLVEDKSIPENIAKGLSEKIQKHTDEANKHIDEIAKTDATESLTVAVELKSAIEEKTEALVIAAEASQSALESKVQEATTRSQDAQPTLTPEVSAKRTATTTAIVETPIEPANITPAESAKTILTIVSAANHAQEEAVAKTEEIKAVIVLEQEKSKQVASNNESTEPVQKPVEIVDTVEFIAVINDIEQKLETLGIQNIQQTNAPETQTIQLTTSSSPQSDSPTQSDSTTSTTATGVSITMVHTSERTPTQVFVDKLILLKDRSKTESITKDLIEEAKRLRFDIESFKAIAIETNNTVITTTPTAQTNLSTSVDSVTATSPDHTTETGVPASTPTSTSTAPTIPPITTTNIRPEIQPKPLRPTIQSRITNILSNLSNPKTDSSTPSTSTSTQ